ncbi:MAG: succinate dehydrogenase/fumarate reductase iron-sulfur subunit [archaeon]|nr:succinate dehydrogenase/fumarate reductase iron-sulfur subunit [archaeon]
MIKIYVYRFNPDADEEPYFECYEIEKTPQMKVLDALQAINDKYDEDISFRSSCRAGQCGSCTIKYNGKGALACQSEIKDGAIIEPINLPIIKDLVVDRSSIEEKVKELNLELQCEKNNSINKEVNNSNIQETKKVRSCIECYSCLASCPVVQHFQNEFGGPYFMRYISKFTFDPREEDRLQDSLKEGLYKCTSCGMCKSVCPKNINTFGDAIEKLRAIAVAADEGPLPEHVVFKENILEDGRSVDIKTGSFIEEINNSDLINKDSKIALFTGCILDYRLQKVGYDLIKVLKTNGIEIDVPKGQVCCGSPLLRTGQIDIVQGLVDTNKEIFKEYDTVLTVCAGCGATLKNNHPEYGSELNVMDISEFLVDKLDYSKMKEVNKKITWHDPCHLRRGQGIKEEPREVIKNIPGVELVEMNHPAQCCGAGGGIKSGEPEIALKLASEKAKMIKSTEAEAVVTICPFCQTNLKDGLEAEGLPEVNTLNIIELLKQAYE